MTDKNILVKGFNLLICLSLTLSMNAHNDCGENNNQLPSYYIGKLVNIENAFAEQLLINAPIDVKKIIYNLNYPPKTLKFIPKKLMLVGPPGCGKSSLAKAIANQTGRYALLVEAPFIANEYKNSGQQNLLKILTEVLKINQPCIIILDEINVLFKANKDQANPDNGILEALWLLLDECAEYSNIFFIATCNDINNIPEALKSRFEGEIVTIALPDANTRKQVIEFHLSQFPHACKPRYVQWLINKTKNLSIRDIEHMLIQAFHHARFANKDHTVHEKDITKALRGIKTWTLREYYEHQKPFLEKLLIHGLPITLSVLGMLLTIKTSNQQYALQHESMDMQKAAQTFQEKMAQENKAIQEQSAQLQKIGIELQRKSLQQQEENSEKQMQQQKAAQEFQEQAAKANYELQWYSANFQLRTTQRQIDNELEKRFFTDKESCYINGEYKYEYDCKNHEFNEWLKQVYKVPTWSYNKKTT